MSHPSVLQGRLCVFAAALLWSLSGAFVKVLTQPTALGLGEPPVPALIIAFYRTLFAGALLLLFVRRSDVSFRPLMLVMVVSFATMNALFVSALSLGTAANAIILQYTAPVWMYVASVFLLGDPSDRRNTVALVIAMLGVVVIVGDAWLSPASEAASSEQAGIAALIALGSGVAYAGVVLCLRVLRGASSQWLTAQNHIFSALVLVPVLWFEATPQWPQLICLIVYGTVALALPYWLVSRGLKVVSPLEVGTITLIEPVLNPLWAYLAAGDVPATSTYWGGALILAALLWRYVPRKG